MLARFRLLDVARRLVRAKQAPATPATEQGPAYYDGAFRAVDAFRQPYAQSPYYFLWTVIIDRLRHLPAHSVLEVACGPGQLAHALHDALPQARYLGFDFSDVAIRIARTRVPQLRFEVADARSTPFFRTVAYDTVVATEFLEHVSADLDILGLMRPGTQFIGTVPNFPYVSHVRHFPNEAAVRARYNPICAHLDVCTIPGPVAGHVFFLMQGRRRA